MKKLTAAELIAVHTVTEMTAEQALSNPREDPFSKEQIVDVLVHGTRLGLARVRRQIRPGQRRRS